MSIFATELQVKTGISKATFVAAIVAWLRGINRSTILEVADAYEDYEDEIWRETANGETLSLKSFEKNGLQVFGARLEIPDEAGRKWRTECVLTDLGSAAFLRVRGQCVATHHSAQVVMPKKPHIIRQAIEDGWCVADGSLIPSLEPVALSDSQIDLATAAVEGHVSSLLPTLYISRGNQDHLPFNAAFVAKSLAGICHVMVEPSRDFSFELMETTQRRNPYGGAVSLFSPDGREQFRAFKKYDDRGGSRLAADCIERVSGFVSALAAKKAWEWQDLQEAQSRRLRELASDSTSDDLDTYVAAFDVEIDAYKERIENLEARLAISEARADSQQMMTEDLFPAELKKRIGPELYDGEFSDRLRSFIVEAMKNPATPRNNRTDEFAKRLLEELKFSGRSQSLISQIKSACRDGNQMPKQLGSLLSGFGFSKSNDGPHLKFEPPEELFGLGTEVLPSTPSDSQRGGKNRGSEVIRSFGLNELK